MAFFVLVFVCAGTQAQNETLKTERQTELKTERQTDNLSTSKTESPVVGKIKSLGLFKNGVVIVQEEIAVPATGRYTLTEVPAALHGTFFLTSDAQVETTITQRAVTQPLDASNKLDYQKDLAGKKVTIYFNQAGIEPLSGVVATLPEKSERSAMNGNSSSFRNSFAYNYSSDIVAASGEKLVLNTVAGQTILNQASISRIDIQQGTTSVTRKQPAMVFNVKTDKPTAIQLFYLTRGISWAPSYRIDLADSNRLTIEQTALIVNELKPFSGANVSLISGFPKIECENVYAPFSPGSSLKVFFQQLSNRSNPRQNDYMAQQAIVYNALPPTLPDTGDSAAAVSGEGADIHYQNIGARSMNPGDCLSLSNGKQNADYERVVEWTIPDTRDAWGRYQDNDRNGEAVDKSELWDMIRFRNPFSFPMTTAPATIVAQDRFMGQNSSFWAAPGEMTKIPVTKSMSVRGRAAEYEKEAGNEGIQYVDINGNRYRRATVEVELTLVNRRAEAVKMLVNRRFAGDLTETVADAKVVALADDLSYLNRKREIQWELTLSSGETKVLKYVYTTLIR